MMNLHSYYINGAMVVVALSTSVLAFNSCVDDKYDITKPIDTEITVGAGLAMPVGDIEPFKLSKLLDLEGQDFIKLDKDSSYVIVADNLKNPYKYTYEVPNFAFNNIESSNQRQYIDIPTIPEGQFPDQTFPIDINFTINFSQDIPAEITDIHSANVNAELKLVCNFIQDPILLNNIWLKKGARVEIPKWIQLGNITHSDIDVNDNVLTFNKDIRIASDGLSISLPVSGLLFDDTTLAPGNGISNGRFNIIEEIPFSGTLVLKSSDVISGGNGNFIVSAQMGLSNITINSIKVCVDPDIKFDIPDVVIGEMPEAFQSVNLNMDLNAVRLDVSISNESPLAADLDCTIMAIKSSTDSKDSTKISGLHVMAGSDGNPVRSSFSISENGNLVAPGYTAVKAERLNSLISSLPDIIRFSSVNLDVSKDPVEVVLGSTYDLDVYYNCETPLSFGENLNLEFSTDIDNLDLDLAGYNIREAKLNLELINTIPLGLTLEAEALDITKNPIETISIDVDGDVLPGSVEKPSSQKRILTLHSDDGNISLSGIRLYAVAKSEAGKTDSKLNAKQGLELKSLSLCLPEGITIDLEEL